MSNNLLKKYDAIEQMKAHFLKKVEGFSDEQLNTIPVNNGWSAAQVLYHCAFVEDGVIVTIQKNLAENKVYIQKDFKSILRSVFLDLALKSPLKFKAPKVVSKVPNQVSLVELKKFNEANSIKFLQILHELPAELEDKYIFKHPISGLFTIHQTLDFLYKHFVHHERQLDALL